MIVGQRGLVRAAALFMVFCSGIPTIAVPQIPDDDRERLFEVIPHEAEGLSAEAVYTGEFFSNTRGGLNTNDAVRYRSVFELSLNGDLEQLFGLPGSSVFINFGDIHGQSASLRDVGDWQYVSNIDSTPYQNLTQLNEYWLQQKLGESLWFKVGRIDANADFAFADLAGDFTNSSFGQMPTIPLPVWPAQSLGVTGYAQLTDDLLLAVGTYEANKMGPNWGQPVPGDPGYVTLGHLELKTYAGEDELPGTWRFGSWYQSGGWTEITPAPVPRVFGQNYGIWTTADQMLFVEDDADEDPQGLGIFFEYGWAPEDRNFVRESFGTGFVYRGLVPERDFDMTGIGMTRVQFGDPTTAVTGQTAETTFETFYKCQVRRYFSVQPDLQYIVQPNGLLDDALAVGLRFELVL